MDRGERRDRTARVVARRVSEWRAFNGAAPSKVRAGRARDASLLACGCSGHNGMCHATVKSHGPLVERRANRFDWRWATDDIFEIG